MQQNNVKYWNGTNLRCD